MTSWVLFGILALLVFGIPLIDDLYKMKVRRRAAQANQISDESPSLVPNVDQENLIDSESRFVKIFEKLDLTTPALADFSSAASTVPSCLSLPAK